MNPPHHGLDIDLTTPQPTGEVCQIIDFIRGQVLANRAMQTDDQILAVLYSSASQTHRIFNLGAWGNFLRLDIGADQWIITSPHNGHFLITLITPDPKEERREIGFKA